MTLWAGEAEGFLLLDGTVVSPSSLVFPLSFTGVVTLQSTIAAILWQASVRPAGKSSPAGVRFCSYP